MEVESFYGCFGVCEEGMGRLKMSQKMPDKSCFKAGHSLKVFKISFYAKLFSI